MNRSLVAGLALLAVVLAAYSGHQRATHTALAARVDTLTRVERQLDTIYRDSLTIATRWKTRWDTVRVRDTMTIVRNDTTIVYVRRDVADSTINACFAVLRACDRAGVAKDTLNAALRAQLLAAQPKLAQRVTDASTGAVIGALLALILTAK